MSYPYFNGLTAIAHGAAKDQLKGRREFLSIVHLMHPLSIYKTVIRIGGTPSVCRLIYSGIGNRI